MLFADTLNVQNLITIVKFVVTHRSGPAAPCSRSRPRQRPAVCWCCDRRCCAIQYLDGSGSTRTKETPAVQYEDGAGKPITEAEVLLEKRRGAHLEAKQLWNLLGKSDADRVVD